MAPKACPAHADFLRWLNEELDPAERSEIDSHVNGCDRCQRELEELTRRQAYKLGAGTFDGLKPAGVVETNRSPAHPSALENDERVFLMGEDIGVYGGAFQVTGNLVERFGEERVMDMPISELGGAGVGRFTGAPVSR